MTKRWMKANVLNDPFLYNFKNKLGGECLYYYILPSFDFFPSELI